MKADGCSDSEKAFYSLSAFHLFTEFQQMCAARNISRAKPKKRCTLTQANKNSVPKTTGKKAHKKLGPRCHLVPTLGNDFSH